MGNNTQTSSGFNPFGVAPKLIALLSEALSTFRSGADGTHKLMEVIRPIDTICQASPDAAIAVVHLTVIESPLKQPLYSAILCNLLARRLEYDNEARTKLMLAILTSNIALAELQVLLNNSDMPLTQAQRDKIQQHPIESVKILEKAGIDDVVWLTTIAQHHERADGSGYPKGLRETRICQDAIIVALGEFYTAMIDKRAYRSPMKAQDAMRELYDKSTKRERMLQVNFMKEIGIFPPGSFVKLTNGEIAIVWKRNGDQPMPFVKAIMDPSGKFYLGGLTRDCSKSEYKIAKPCSSPANIKMDLFAFWQPQ